MSDWLISITIEVDCGEPATVEGAIIDHFLGTTLGKFAQYSCVEGHRLIGLQTRTCLADGTWSGDEPYCEGEYTL